MLRVLKSASSHCVLIVVRLDSLAPLTQLDHWLLLAVLVPISLYTFISLGLYRAVLRYMNSQAIWAIVLGTVITTIALVLIAFFINIDIPRTMPFIFVLAYWFAQ